MKLQSKILLTVIISTTFFTSIKELKTLYTYKKNAEIELSNKVEVTGQLFSRVVANSIYNLNYDLLQETLIPFMDDPDIESIQITEVNGSIPAFHEHDNINLNNIIKQNIIIDYRGITLGEAEIIYTKSNILNKLKQGIIDIVFSTILLILVLVLYLFLMLRKLIKPIIELTELSVQISQGHLDKNIEIYSNDEIGILTKSFILMKESIKSKIEQIQVEIENKNIAEKRLVQLNNQLEEKVLSRTKELEMAFSNLQNTQKKLVDSEKMSSLGIIVAGVAHEINTPVGIGVTAASHLKDIIDDFRSDLNNDRVTRSKIETFLSSSEEISKIILSNMFRSRSLINSFKNIAVDQTSEQKRIINVKAYFEDILLSTQSKFKRRPIDIKLNCSPHLLLNSYPGALSQVITNLLMNSLNHAFDDVDSGEININIKHKDDNLIINFNDTGKGINDEDLQRIFDPFFTTKRGSGGSGLGLSIVYNLVKKTLCGDIECTSKRGIGTTFIITIPGHKSNLNE